MELTVSVSYTVLTLADSGFRVILYNYNLGVGLFNIIYRPPSYSTADVAVPYRISYLLCKSKHDSCVGIEPTLQEYTSCALTTKLTAPSHFS